MGKTALYLALFVLPIAIVSRGIPYRIGPVGIPVALFFKVKGARKYLHTFTASVSAALGIFLLAASGALEGLGKGVPSLVISLLRYVVIIIPAAWLLSRSFGAQGVWHAFWLAELITAAAAQLVYKRFSK